MIESQETKGQKEGEKIAAKPVEYIKDRIPESKHLIQCVTVDFTLPSEWKLRLHGRRVLEDVGITEDVGIPVAPRYLGNRLRNLRRKFYKELNKAAFVLGKGEGRRNLYLMPMKNVDEFIKFTDGLRNEFKVLEACINSYLTKKTTQKDQVFLEKVEKHVGNEKRVFRKEISDSVQLVPFLVS